MPRLTHYAIATAHMDKTLHFYCGFCAMRIVHNRVKATRISWLAPKHESSPILVVIEHPEIPYCQTNSDSMLRHFGFELGSQEEVNEVFEMLKANGYNPTKPVFVDEITGYICMVQDPDGRWVEFSFGQDLREEKWDPIHSS